MADSVTYGANNKIAQLKRRWPSGRAMPQLLLDVADYFADKEIGSLGYFSMSGYRVDDYWNCQAGDMWPYFAGILSTGSGERASGSTPRAGFGTPGKSGCTLRAMPKSSPTGIPIGTANRCSAMTVGQQPLRLPPI